MRKQTHEQNRFMLATGVRAVCSLASTIRIPSVLNLRLAGFEAVPTAAARVSPTLPRGARPPRPV